ncbi:MAG: zf-TFIIB domain-containing protein [Gemmatimonadetes bacterium]|nr:zf-TFIIB domain-containing protein [Gemmatimonadota bacterium]
MADPPVVPPGARRPLEARFPCPVCLGVQMEKVQLNGRGGALVLDHCPRCGGVWFERGEVQQLTRHLPAQLWRLIPPRQTAPKPPCHGCHTPLDRDAPRCEVCGRKNELACPVCDQTLARRQHGRLTLDVCASCRGVWFDHAELRSVWSLSAELSVSRGSMAGAVAGDVLLHTLFWAPDAVVYTAGAAMHGLGNLAGAAANISPEGAAEAALGAAEAVGGAAEGVFATIMEIIGSLFE